MRSTIIRIPRSKKTGRVHPQAWLPDPPRAEQLRALAGVAMEAARSAGADFADIRIGVQRHIVVPQAGFSPNTGMSVGYGVRAWINGTWSFQHGNLFTNDAVAAAARSAVAGARTYAAVNQQLAQHFDAPVSAWAPAPVVTGEWRAPMEIDPFQVPLDDYFLVLGTLVDTTAPAWRLAVSAFALGWRAETRVFASTSGSMVTQEFLYGGATPRGVAGIAGGIGGEGGVEIDVPGPGPVIGGGFETVLDPNLVSRVMAGMDDAIRWRELPERNFTDVGRFPILFDGAATAGLIGYTMNLALDGDRVSGLEADASGGSFLSPAADILGASSPQCSPLLTMTADRALPSAMAVQWDDDGVVPEPYALIDAGHVVDYHTTRETAPMLADWYRHRGQPLRSHGTAVAPTPASIPMGSCAHVHVTPSKGRTNVEDMMREISHGFFVRGGEPNVSPELTLGTMGSRDLVLEIQRGVPVARTYVPLQFATKTLLNKNLLALGGANTARTATIVVEKGMPWQDIQQLVTAPSALCKDVDVVGVVSA